MARTASTEYRWTPMTDAAGPGDRRFWELMEEIRPLVGEEMVDQLEQAVCQIATDSQMHGVRSHGRQILEMIAGDRYDHDPD